MRIDFLMKVFEENAEKTAVVWRHQKFSYAVLFERVSNHLRELERLEVASGSIVGLEGDFSPSCIALFLALTERNCVIVPHTNANHTGRERKDEIAEVECYFRFDEKDQVRFERTNRKASHSYYQTIRQRQVPGLVLFSSGTSGDPKGAVHDFTALLEKFQTRRKALVTLNFLLFDHWGGLNTMLHTLSNGATIVTVSDRSPEGVCALIEETGAELLPATPTFLNLLLLSGAYKTRNLQSLKVISYGAEPMLESTLRRLREVFPHLTLQQTYGLIEVGVLRSKSREDGSLWVKLGGEGYQMRVVDGILHIKTKSTILGYLNAEAPITEDGWFITGDAVHQEGEYFRILGRKSELINIGGEKVYPVEVENCIQALENISEVTVYAEKNPIMGNILCAKVRLTDYEDPKEVAVRVKNHCQLKLARFKVPVKVKVVDEVHYGDRFKKRRVGELGAETET